jgi:hypothetical protein
MITLPVKLPDCVLYPNAVFAAPVVFDDKEKLPMAILLLPVVAFNALYPTPTLLEPVVFTDKQVLPKAVFCDPVVFALLA